ncbi:MAG: cellulose biosynthesis cyclic di-GMP-binding regulatory protein BcsB [Oscillospiraceae bacterium]|jgi:hypothetical protein|nr:cellulose biosynthesis cyclic di-GMP-binding regulatory protein BcsB [Oscillospiraceae bacterium]
MKKATWKVCAALALSVWMVFGGLWAMAETIDATETSSLRSGYGNVSAERFNALAQNPQRGSQHMDFSLNGTQTLQGIFTSTGLSATAPAYAQVESVLLRVSYSCSELILTHLSSLTFSMNDTPFYSCPVVYSAEGPTVLYIEVPKNLFDDGYNSLTIRGYVRLTEGEGCTDDYTGGNWINLHEQTTLRIAYTLVEDEQHRLGYFPYPFISTLNETGKGLSLCVSDSMDDGELAAALLLMSTLDDEVADPNEIEFGTWGEAGGAGRILFSLIDHLPQSLTPLVEDQALPTDGALIRRTKDAKGDLLLVTAQRADALMEAARLLGDNSRVTQLDQDHYIVRVGEADILLQNEALSDAIVADSHTLKEIMGRGISLSGPFHQEATIYLPVSSDYTLSAEGRFSFQFRYSNNLDFTRSLITVFWGDVPIASKMLTAAGAAGDTLTFTPPLDVTGTTGSSMRVAFELEMEDLVCTPRQMNMPWAYVSEDSLFYLPLGQMGSLNLSNRPAPFQRDGRLNEVLVVLPDAPSAQELNLAGQTLSMLGVGSDAYGKLSVVRASAFVPTDANIVAVGTAQSNSFLQTLNPSLHFRYDSAFEKFVSNEQWIIDGPLAQSASTVQLLQSPYGADRAILAVAAVNAGGLERLTQLMSVEKMRWTLQGDAVLLDQNMESHTFLFRTFQDTTTEEKPLLVENLIEGGQGTLFTLVAVGVMLVLLVSVALVLLRVQMRKK